MVTALGLWSSGPWAQPATYVLEPGHSFVHFEVLHFGTSTSSGRWADQR